MPVTKLLRSTGLWVPGKQGAAEITTVCRRLKSSYVLGALKTLVALLSLGIQ